MRMATLVRFREPFRELTALQNEMSRMFGGLIDGETRTNQSWVPAVDVWETGDELVYAFDLPGIPRDKISVEFDDGALTISGERERVDEARDDGFYRYERRFGSFSRTVGLPQGVTEDDVKADYRDGVLEVKVAKPETPKPRRIQVGSGKDSAIEGTSIQK
jgi:HSP20 family protein